MATIPIFMYHHVNPNKGDMVTITPEDFGAQMRFLKESGCRTLTLTEAIGASLGTFETKEKCCVITFDDGYLDNFVYAYPEIAANGIKAAVFIVTDWIDAASSAREDKKSAAVDECKKRPPTHNYAKTLIAEGLHHKAVMNWDMISEMNSGAPVEFHSHTMSHLECDKAEPDKLAVELAGSKDAINAMLNKDCKYLCWPKGLNNAAAIEAAKEAGYEGIFTTAPGVIKKGIDPFAMPRIAIKEGASWLKSRLKIYTNPLMADIYLKVKG